MKTLRSPLALACLAVALVLPSAAQAASARVIDLGGGPPTLQTVRYLAGDGEQNSLRVSYDAARGLVTLVDTAGITPGAGCTRPAPANTTRVQCTVKLPDAPGITAELGDRDDTAVVTQLAAKLIGGDGNDELTGGPGPNTLDGGNGADKLTGGKLGDRISGGFGRDILNGRGGKDRLRGGAGADNIDGGRGNDRISGGRGTDLIAGRSGNDVINARDNLVDDVSCGRGRDRVRLDGFDQLRDLCERRSRPFPPAATVLNAALDGDQALVDVGCPRDAPRRCKGRVSIVRHGRKLASRRVNLLHGKSRELGLTLPSDVVQQIGSSQQYFVSVVVRSLDRLGRIRVVSVDFDLAG